MDHIKDILHKWILYAEKDKDVRSIVFGGHIDLHFPTKEEYIAEFNMISADLSRMKKEIDEKEKLWEEEETGPYKQLVEEAISIKNRMKIKIQRLHEIEMILGGFKKGVI